MQLSTFIFCPVLPPLIVLFAHVPFAQNSEDNGEPYPHNNYSKDAHDVLLLSGMVCSYVINYTRKNRLRIIVANLSSYGPQVNVNRGDPTDSGYHRYRLSAHAGAREYIFHIDEDNKQKLEKELVLWTGPVCLMPGPTQIKRPPVQNRLLIDVSIPLALSPLSFVLYTIRSRLKRVESMI